VLRAGASGALGLAGALHALASRPGAVLLGGGGPSGGRPGRRDVGYGPLAPVLDETTGLPLLRLPAGFRYRTFGWARDLMLDGRPTPASHDGMAVVMERAHVAVLVRNHEERGSGPSVGSPAMTFDPLARGGTTTLWFDLHRGEWLGARLSLAGTSTNCTGGRTPWGSWLSGEETTAGRELGYATEHGWVFEVPANAPAHPVPLRAMGRFTHEAAVAHPHKDLILLTEDFRYASGLYRFRPRRARRPYDLEDGGVLEMLRVVGRDQADLQVVRAGDAFDVAWVPVADPEAPPRSGVGPFGSFDGSTTTASGPFLQGWDLGAARFRRLEGAWFGDHGFYFVDTEGGRPAVDVGRPEGTIWHYDPRRERIRVVYESPAESELDNPDNVTVAPHGALVLCEDGHRDALRLQGMTRDGVVFPFAENAVVLNGEVNGFVGDFRDSEWAGATFDKRGRWLFVNIRAPGITFAITGPFDRGPLG